MTSFRKKMLYFVKLLCHKIKKGEKKEALPELSTHLSSSQGFARSLQFDLEGDASVENDHYGGLHINRALRV